MPRRLKLVLPALAAVILALPCFSYTYLYDAIAAVKNSLIDCASSMDRGSRDYPALT